MSDTGQPRIAVLIDHIESDRSRRGARHPQRKGQDAHRHGLEPDERLIVQGGQGREAGGLTREDGALGAAGLLDDLHFTAATLNAMVGANDDVASARNQSEADWHRRVCMGRPQSLHYEQLREVLSAAIHCISH